MAAPHHLDGLILFARETRKSEPRAVCDDECLFPTIDGLSSHLLPCLPQHLEQLRLVGRLEEGFGALDEAPIE